MPISLHVNGQRVDAQVLPRLDPADFLREHFELTVTNAVNDALRPFVILAALGRI
jgi:aerobic-type carbon monoxide dehydrogenase small subunit (CoxS/CutS family)